jgi:hypothetical protein
MMHITHAQAAAVIFVAFLNGGLIGYFVHLLIYSRFLRSKIDDMPDAFDKTDKWFEEMHVRAHVRNPFHHVPEGCEKPQIDFIHPFLEKQNVVVSFSPDPELVKMVKDMTAFQNNFYQNPDDNA